MFAGFDTSNYTTSAAVMCDSTIKNYKKMLSVAENARGLRQSDAVFQHTVNMPDLLSDMAEDFDLRDVKAVGVSARPRNAAGSYMPCFLVGLNTAKAAAAFCGCKCYETSHQVGHILAALYSAEKLDLIKDRFLAFHVSGGTTEAVLVTPDREQILKADIVAASIDLKAGQAIDRTGVLLGMRFPCGAELEKEAEKSNRDFKIRASMQGCNCSFSGIENKVKIMIANGESKCDIAKFALESVRVSLDSMLSAVLQEYGSLPVVFAGGVSSNKTIRKTVSEKFGAYFAEPRFSSDNAAGTAVFAALKSL